MSSAERRAEPLSDDVAARVRLIAMRAQPTPTALPLYGVVGEDIRLSSVEFALEALGKVDRLDIRISSPGGDVIEGMAIYNVLARHPAAEKIVTIEGIAASMASLLAMVGTEIVIPANSYIMIHDPIGGVVGRSGRLRQHADLLDHIRETALRAYADRTGQTREVISDMMSKETYLGAEEALALGFADRIEKPIRMSAALDLGSLPNLSADIRASLETLQEPRMATKKDPAAPLPAENDAPTPNPAPTRPDPEPRAEPSGDPKVEVPALSPVVEPLEVKAPQMAAEPAALARMCHEAGFAVLTASLLASGASMKVAQMRVEEARSIKEMTVRLGRPEAADALLESGVGLESARKLMFAMGAQQDEQIATHTMKSGPALASTGVDAGAVYSKLNNRKKG